MEMVIAKYTNWSNPDTMEEVHIQLAKLYGDIVYRTPAFKTADLHGQLSNQSRNY